jgi:hypothetical protein
VRHENRSFEATLQPLGHIRILDWQVRERGRPTLGQSRVEGREVAVDDARRAAVRHEPVKGEDQHVLILGLLQESRAPGRHRLPRSAQEGVVHHLLDHLLQGRRAPVLGNVAKIESREGHPGFVQHILAHLAILFDKARPQDGMALRKVPESLLEENRVQPSPDGEDGHLVIYGSPKTAALHIPDALLQGREEEAAGPRIGTELR